MNNGFLWEIGAVRRLSKGSGNFLSPPERNFKRHQSNQRSGKAGAIPNIHAAHENAV